MGKTLETFTPPLPAASTRPPSPRRPDEYFGTGRGFRGFTLIELLVTIAILSFLLLFINQMFVDTSVTVGIGVATSNNIANARALSDQLDRDVRAMVGPQDGLAGEMGGGFLVIINRSVQATMPVPHGGYERVDVRDDQLLFVRTKGQDLVELVGVMDTTSPRFNYGAMVVWMTRSPNVLVWYGHVEATDASGNDIGRLGAVGGGNEYANRWYLGRQARFLSDYATDNTGDLANAAVADVPPAGGGGVRVGPRYNATVSNVPAPNNQLYRGTCDIVGMPLESQTGACVVGATTNAGALLQGMPLGVYPTPGQIDAYNKTAISFAYPRTDFLLRGNPHPTESKLDPWRLAQVHPVFGAGVSDFIVEFAADTLGTGRPDVDDKGQLLWYAASAVNASTDSRLLTRPIAYGNYGSLTSLTGDTQNGGAFIFRHDDEQGRYALAYSGINFLPLSPSNWPFAIRLRWRMHDPRGRLMSRYPPSAPAGGDDLITGAWYEQVIPVRRPTKS